MIVALGSPLTLRLVEFISETVTENTRRKVNINVLFFIFYTSLILYYYKDKDLKAGEARFSDYDKKCFELIVCEKTEER